MTTPYGLTVLTHGSPTLGRHRLYRRPELALEMGGKKGGSGKLLQFSNRPLHLIQCALYACHYETDVVTLSLVVTVYKVYGCDKKVLSFYMECFLGTGLIPDLVFCDKMAERYL
jgi:hypothetical protein